MALSGGRGEAGEVGHRNGGGGFAELFGGRRPPGPEDDGDVVTFDPGAMGQSTGGFLRDCPGVLHDRQLSAGVVAVRYLPACPPPPPRPSPT